MPRTVPEWVGKSDNDRPPPRVRLRIYDAYDGRCQCGCERKIQAGEAWDLDHYVPLISGGGNRELNMRPLLREHHKAKTRADMQQKSRDYQIRARHIGIRTKSKFPCGRDSKWKKCVDGSVVRR